jgi:hypothetical protein
MGTKQIQCETKTPLNRACPGSPPKPDGLRGDFLYCSVTRAYNAYIIIPLAGMTTSIHFIVFDMFLNLQTNLKSMFSAKTKYFKMAQYSFL